MQLLRLHGEDERISFLFRCVSKPHRVRSTLRAKCTKPRRLSVKVLRFVASASGAHRFNYLGRQRRRQAKPASELLPDRCPAR
jgi:hypothetical protein